MAETRKCPQCGDEIPADAPEGLCPNCLLKVELQTDGGAQVGSGPAPTATYSGRFVPPHPAELAPYFPQLEIIELLGQGGMGAVYKARQSGLDRLVALKILPQEIGSDPAFAERFTREARALARLSHPNIVAVYDFGRTSALPSPFGRGDHCVVPGGEGAAGEAVAGAGLFYFIMEYVDGVNLRQAIQSGGISPKEALAIVPQICDALQFAHDDGIVHRDIKPENVLVDKKGRVKIADFGLAKLLGQAPGDISLTGSQQVMGTLRYMAPEQMEGTKAVDHRADIYSLGVVFYELPTGELPIGRFAPPSKKVEIDVRLDEVVLRALEKEPEQRYQHVSEVKTDLEAVRGTSGDREPARAGNREGTSSDGVRAAKVLTAMGALTLASAVCAFLLLIGAFVDTYHFDRFFRQDEVRIPLLILQTLAIPAGAIMLLGGLWPRPQGSSWSRFGAALGLLPLTPAWLITLPLGIWAFGALAHPQQAGSMAEKAVQAGPQRAGPSSVPLPQMLGVAIGLVLGLLFTTIGVLLIPAAFIFANAGPGVLGGLLGSALGCLGGGLGSLAGSWNTYRQLRGQTDWMKMTRWTALDSALAVYGFFGLALLLGGIFVKANLGEAVQSVAATGAVWAVLLVGGLVLFQAALFLLFRAPFILSRGPGQRGEAEDRGSPLGPISLLSAIAGLVLPIMLVLIIGLLDSALKLNVSAAYLVLCGMLGAGLELVGLGCGVVARRTASGKAGLIISIISVVLYGLLFPAVMISPASSNHDPGPTEERSGSPISRG
jgi:hypothetical protein